MADNFPNHQHHVQSSERARGELSDVFVGGQNTLLQDNFEAYSVNDGASDKYGDWGGDAASTREEDDATEMGPARLFAILEDALPRPGDNRPLSSKEIQNRNEMVEHTWDQVRRWLWSHRDPQERAAAACIRGQADATPLHMMCKLDNPPSDVISELVAAAPETVSWVDSHGWLPLHHACANGTPTEVLKILADAYPEGKTAQDNQNRTPLHFYATRKPDNPNAMAANVAMLSDTGAAELPDRGGMLPMHYACAYGTCPQVLKVLAEAYPDSLVAKENKGRTPMHLAMVNAHRDASPGVMRFLLESGSSATTVNMRDHEGYLPLHLLALGLKGYRADEFNQRKNVSECLSMYLAAEPVAPADFLTALQDLPDWLQDVAVVSPHVRNILNEKIVQRFPTSILMLDGYFLVALILCFEIATRNHIDILFEPTTRDHTQGYLIVLFIGGSYFFLRELVQIISLWSLGSLSSWFFDTTNWLDMSVIFVVFYFTSLMASDTTLVSNETFRTGVAYAKGILWCAVIYYLKSTLVDFAVFVGGVFYVVQRLAAFMLAVCVILLAFAQMFFFTYIRSPICTPFSLAEAGNLTTANYSICQFPHCTFPRSLLKVYTMMLGEIGDETRYSTSLVSQIVYVAYAFLVVILLSNVLIAIVTDSYEIIQNDRAAIVFWLNRLDFVAEMDAISYGIRSRLSCLGGGRGGAIKNVQEGPSGEGIIINEDDPEKGGMNRVMREGWKQIMVLFDSTQYEEVDFNPSHIEFWCYLCFRVAAVIFVIPLWLIVGAATAGWLWPPQVREYLFVQRDTAISRAELERKKLEQLQKIQVNIKSLKSEIRKEMAGDRGDMIRLKGEVEAVQGEVLSDLQQVKELMTTLLDMGRNRRR